MPTWVAIVGGAMSWIVPFLGYRLLLRKWPTERQQMTVETEGQSVRIAGELRDDALEDRQRMKEELAEFRAEFDRYRIATGRRLDALTVELQRERDEKESVKRENEAVKRENERLTARVTALEEEVATLKSAQRLPLVLDDPPPVDGFSSMHPLPPNGTVT